jgi:hypothetical protein
MEKFKEAYALILLWLTFAWAGFCVWVTWCAIRTAEAGNIIAAGGVDALLGALVSWNALIIQHYFRKSKPTEDEK